MDQTHLHLLTNHVSLFGFVFGLIILLLGFFRKSEDLKFGAAIIFVVAGLMIIPAFQTGEAAEDVVEKLAGVRHDDIEEHEDAANFARIAALAMAVLSVFALVRYRKTKSISKGLSIAMLVIGLWGFSVIARTAYLGGFIRHSEIHEGATSTPIDKSSDE
jgi:uncharacterized membrane protein